MDNKKFEQLIDLIINENEEQARALFHDIVVEKSREIYESIITVEMGEPEQDGSAVEGLLDEIGAEEQGMVEDDEDLGDIEVGGEEEVDLDADEMDDEEGSEDLEDRVVDLEDKLDQLMAEFEELMADEEGEDHGEEGEEFGGDEEGAEDEEGLTEAADDEDDEDDEEESLEESVQLQKVSVTHGDNGQNTKSIVSGGPKVSGNGATPVKAFGGDEKGGKAQAPKDLKGAGSFKNAPGHKGQDLESAPKAKGGDDGSNTKSPVAESKKTVKKIVK